MGVEQILIADLTLDDRFQHRDDGLSAERVEEYAQDVDRLPPPVVFREGGKNWYPGGFHRLAAHQKAGRDKIRCTIRTGTWLEAYQFSLAENSEHGMRRTSADKRKAVMDAKAMSEELGLGWSDRKICELCQVSPNYLSMVKPKPSDLLNLSNNDNGCSKSDATVPPEDDALYVNIHVQEWIADGSLKGAAKDAVLNLGGMVNRAREEKQSQYARRRLPPSNMSHEDALESVRKGGKRDAPPTKPAETDDERQDARQRAGEAIGTLVIEFSRLGLLEEVHAIIEQLSAKLKAA